MRQIRSHHTVIYTPGWFAGLYTANIERLKEKKKKKKKTPFC